MPQRAHYRIVCQALVAKADEIQTLTVILWFLQTTEAYLPPVVELNSIFYLHPDALLGTM